MERNRAEGRGDKGFIGNKGESEETNRHRKDGGKEEDSEQEGELGKQT